MDTGHRPIHLKCKGKSKLDKRKTNSTLFSLHLLINIIFSQMVGFRY